MITINIPSIVNDESIQRFKDRLNHLVKYHPDYENRKFEIQKTHISLVNIHGNFPRELLAHIQELLREFIENSMPNVA